MADTIFRPEALRARSSVTGEALVLRTAPETTPIALIAAALTIGCIALLFFGTYTKRVRLPGVVMPVGGLSRVVSPSPGLITEIYVREGQRVPAGQELFLVSADRFAANSRERQSVSSRSVGEEAERRIREKLRLVTEQRARLSDEEAHQSALLKKRIASLEAEQLSVGEESRTHERRLAIANEQLARVGQLQASGYVTESAVKEKQSDVLDLLSKKQSMERTLLGLARDIDSTRYELAQLPQRIESQLNSLEKERRTLDQELTESQARSSIAVTAPVSGTATAVVAEIGRFAGDAPLATIVPDRAVFEVHLFASSQAIGFVRPGQEVLLRYLAFPYQKFGQYRGVVRTVSRTPLSAVDIGLSTNAGQGEGSYRITVGLSEQGVLANGEKQSLTPGMRVEADVLQDTRRLVEWAFEPLIGFGRRL